MNILAGTEGVHVRRLEPGGGRQTCSGIHQRWEVCSLRSPLTLIHPQLHPNRQPTRTAHFSVDWKTENSHGDQGLREYLSDVADITMLGQGRNDPCPCGSGRKYKRCHLGEVDRFKRAQGAGHAALKHRG